LNVGYSKYYNERYQRKGFVFRGKTKKVHIERQAHFLYILHYIHLNPLDYLPGAENWRVRAKGSVRSTKESLDYLEGYRWSSYFDYLGKQNFPSILTTTLFQDMSGVYAKDLSEYLQSSAESLSYTLE
jgi:putative transposase